MTDSIFARDQVDLTNCDREPIHIPGAILPHGAMLVLDGASLRVLQAAGDTEGLLGRPISALLSRPLDDLFSVAQINRLRALYQEPDLIKPRHMLDPVLRIEGVFLSTPARIGWRAIWSWSSRPPGPTIPLSPNPWRPCS